MDDTAGFPHATGNGWGSDMRGSYARYAGAARSDMGNLPEVSDPYFDDVVLLIRGGGYHGSSVILDSSPRPKVITNNGCTICAGTDTPKKTSGNEARVSRFFKSSIRGSSSSRDLTYFGAALGAEGVMRGDFTIEIWAYSGNNNTLFSPLPQNIGGPALSQNWNWNGEWNHWCLIREAGYLYTLLNGDNALPTTKTYFNGSLDFSPMYFGFFPPNGNGLWDGNYGEIRVTRDHARYPFGGFRNAGGRYIRGLQGTGFPELPPAPGPNLKGEFLPIVHWPAFLVGSNTANTLVSTLSIVSFSQQVELEDILFVWALWEDAGGMSINTPSGYTLLADDNQSGCHFSVFWKLADGTESALTFTLAGGTSTMAVGAISYRNADPSGPQGFAMSGDATTQAAFTPAGQTGVMERGMSIAIGADHAPGAVSGQSCLVTGSNWLENVSMPFGNVHADISSSGLLGKEHAFCVATNKTDTGTVGAPTFTWSTNGTRHHAFTANLLPRTTPLYTPQGN